MKALSLLVALFLIGPVLADAAVKTPNLVNRSSHDITYKCKRYTDNDVLPDHTTTDHPVKEGKTVVIETLEGYIINKSEALGERNVVINDMLGSSSGMAGNETTLLLKKENSYQQPYFIVYRFETSQGQDGNGNFIPGRAYKLFVMAECNIEK